MNTTITLAEALLRRKELQGLIDRLKPIHDNVEKLFVTRTKRQNVNESTDNIVAHVPRIEATQVDAYYNWLAKQLRLIDAAIQRANWDTNLEIKETVMADFIDPGLPKDEHKHAAPSGSE
jgi:hypothetical protein